MAEKYEKYRLRNVLVSLYGDLTSCSYSGDANASFSLAYHENSYMAPVPADRWSGLRIAPQGRLHSGPLNVDNGADV